MMRTLCIGVVLLLTSACGDFGGRGDTDTPCNMKEKWPEHQCPAPMLCNQQTGKCSTAVCQRNEDCACGVYMHPRVGEQQKCYCGRVTTTSTGGMMGLCYRLYP